MENNLLLLLYWMTDRKLFNVYKILTILAVARKAPLQTEKKTSWFYLQILIFGIKHKQKTNKCRLTVDIYTVFSCFLTTPFQQKYLWHVARYVNFR